MGWISWIILGALAGWIAKAIMKEEGGLLKNIILGVIGGVVGGGLAQLIGGNKVDDFSIYSLIVAVLGAILVIWVVRLVTGKR
jgi:uncharacterized membrane protein YeaQ/YmgE (transglycosylase-associated protein family)